jgi:hypothetical protein
MRSNWISGVCASRLTVAIAVLVGLPSAVHAAEEVPGHPRISQVDSRLERQQQRIDNGVKDNQINAQQTANDEKRDPRVAQQLSKDEAEHDGHITKYEQKRLNRELNRNSRKIHRQRH